MSIKLKAVICPTRQSDSKLSFAQHVSQTQSCHLPSMSVRLKGSRVSRDCTSFGDCDPFTLTPKLFLNLYRSITEPMLTYCSMLFLPSVSVSQKKTNFSRLQTLHQILSDFLILHVSEITDRSVLCRARSVLADSSYPLHNEFQLPPAARRSKQ